MPIWKQKRQKQRPRYHALSDQIKAAEKRMAEIAVLRTHIVNYAKTRDTYVAYRKAGYSRKFRQEHEEEILLHQAAKEAFNELNVKKLPTIKELQTEYAQLLADKKKAYGEYRQARAAMRELLTVKNNVDRVLADGADRDATERKRPRPAVSWSRSKAFARTRSHRLKICVQRGLGDFPQQARGAIWIATGIACQSLPSLSCNITKSDFMCVLLYLLTLSSTIARRTRVCAGPCESRQRIARTNTHRPVIREVQEMPGCPDAIHPSE